MVIDSDKSDATLEQRSRALFDEQVANQDARTRSRLNQARQAALVAAHTQSRFGFGGWLLPVGSVAVLALAVVTVQFMRPAADTASGTVLASSVADIEILTAEADLELLQNMDFYAWVATQPEGLGAEQAAGEAG